MDTSTAMNRFLGGCGDSWRSLILNFSHFMKICAAVNQYVAREGTTIR